MKKVIALVFVTVIMFSCNTGNPEQAIVEKDHYNFIESKPERLAMVVKEMTDNNIGKYGRALEWVRIEKNSILFASYYIDHNNFDTLYHVLHISYAKGDSSWSEARDVYIYDLGRPFMYGKDDLSLVDMGFTTTPGPDENRHRNLSNNEVSKLLDTLISSFPE
jgi:hypothetical protein